MEHGSTWKARSDVGENKLLPRFQFLTRSARSFFTTFAPSTRPIYAQSSRIRRSSPLVRMRAAEPRCSAELNISQRSIKYAANVTARYKTRLLGRCTYIRATCTGGMAGLPFHLPLARGKLRFTVPKTDRSIDRSIRKPLVNHERSREIEIFREGVME